MRRPRGSSWAEVLRVHNMPTTVECIHVDVRLSPKGYPRVKVDGELRYVTHVLMEMSGSPRPPGMQYCHGDDCGGDRACVNIAHGRWGTHQDNINDKTRQARHSHGETHGMVKLSSDLVITIREAYVDWVGPRGQFSRETAARLGVTHHAIEDILTRRTWKHLP